MTTGGSIASFDQAINRPSLPKMENSDWTCDVLTLPRSISCVRAEGHLLAKIVFACNLFESKTLDQIELSGNDFRELLIEMPANKDCGIREFLIGPGEVPGPAPEG